MTLGERRRPEAIRAWMDARPALQRECADRWELTVGTAYPGDGPRHLVRASLADGTPVVLKLSPSPWLADEARALAHWNGAGAVRILASDVPHGALLLERAEPGTALASLCARDDRAAAAAAARLMQELHSTPAGTPALPAISDWVEVLEHTLVPSVPPTLRRAGSEALRVGRELAAAADRGVVLHGDLHHDNIIRAERASWLAIDPKGVIGPREADAAALLRNPRSLLLSHARPELLIRDRIGLIADHTDLEPGRLRLWGWVLAVLAAWWSFEDRETDWARWLACAEAIQRSG